MTACYAVAAAAPRAPNNFETGSRSGRAGALRRATAPNCSRVRGRWAARACPHAMCAAVRTKTDWRVREVDTMINR